MGELDRDEIAARYEYVHEQPNIVRYLVAQAIVAHRRSTVRLDVDDYLQAEFLALWATCRRIDPRVELARFIGYLKAASAVAIRQAQRKGLRETRLQDPWIEALSDVVADGRLTPEQLTIYRDLVRKLGSLVRVERDPYLEQVYDAQVAPLFGAAAGHLPGTKKRVRRHVGRLLSMVTTLTAQQ